MSIFSQLFGKKKLSKEIQECEEAAAKRPNDPNLLKRLGDLYLKSNDAQNAADVYVRLGELYSGKGFYPKAIALYRQAQKISPSWERPFEKLAELYQLQGFVREAAAQYAKLSEIIEQNGDSERAIAIMQKAADLAPGHKQMHKQVHTFDVKEKAMTESTPATYNKPQVEKADFFDLNQELDKEIDELFINETHANTTVDDTGVASVFKAMEENVAQEGADDPLFLYNMGLAYLETGLIDDAIDAFQRVIGMGEKLFDAYIMLGICYRESGQYKESLQALNAGASLKNLSGEMKVGILYEIAQTYKVMGELQQALGIFKEIQKERKDFKDVELEIVRLAGGG